jgi:hypothetical protein
MNLKTSKQKNKSTNLSKNVHRMTVATKRKEKSLPQKMLRQISFSDSISVIIKTKWIPGNHHERKAENMYLFQVSQAHQGCDLFNLIKM